MTGSEEKFLFGFFIFERHLGGAKKDKRNHKRTTFGRENIRLFLKAEISNCIYNKGNGGIGWLGIKRIQMSAF
jgi:hypothetical protein